MKSFAVLSILLLCSPLFAATVTTPEGIRIESTSMSLNMKTGVLAYKGKVVVTQDGMTYRADFIEVHRKNKVLTKLEAFGNPTIYIDELVSSKGLAKGEAVKLVYTAEDSKVVLEEFFLKYGSGNTVRAKHGVYLLEK